MRIYQCVDRFANHTLVWLAHLMTFLSSSSSFSSSSTATCATPLPVAASDRVGHHNYHTLTTAHQLSIDGIQTEFHSHWKHGQSQVSLWIFFVCSFVLVRFLTSLFVPCFDSRSLTHSTILLLLLLLLLCHLSISSCRLCYFQGAQNLASWQRTRKTNELTRDNHSSSGVFVWMSGWTSERMSSSTLHLLEGI